MDQELTQKYLTSNIENQSVTEGRRLEFGMVHSPQKMSNRVRREFSWRRNLPLFDVDGESEEVGGRMSVFLFFPLYELHFSMNCWAHEMIVTESRTSMSICGCLVARMRVTLWIGLRVAYSICQAASSILLSVCESRSILETPMWNEYRKDLCDRWCDLYAWVQILQMRVANLTWEYRQHWYVPYCELFFLWRKESEEDGDKKMMKELNDKSIRE